MLLSLQGRKYTRRTVTKYALSALHKAAELVKSPDAQSRLCCSRASRQFNIPESTLRRFCHSGALPKGKGRKPMLTPQQEQKIFDTCIRLCDTFLGVGWKTACKAAYQIAQAAAMATRTPNPFGIGRSRCSYDWFIGFCKRFPQMTQRVPQSTSVNRVCGLTRVEANRFYDNLSDVYSKHNYDAKDIWNVDETGE
eukprot:GHVU01090549.1.p1 GENE.GHVU01090549.1~~GHVU01090549.1.p1  ORF type:complete len:195 (-),score=23.80 GHVU01090549.1:146-730(-)